MPLVVGFSSKHIEFSNGTRSRVLARPWAAGKQRISTSGVDTSAPRALSPWRTRIDMETPHTPTAGRSRSPAPAASRLTASCESLARCACAGPSCSAAQARGAALRLRHDPPVGGVAGATAHRPFEIAAAESMPKKQSGRGRLSRRRAGRGPPRWAACARSRTSAATSKPCATGRRGRRAFPLARSLPQLLKNTNGNLQATSTTPKLVCVPTRHRLGMGRAAVCDTYCGT